MAHGRRSSNTTRSPAGILDWLASPAARWAEFLQSRDDEGQEGLSGRGTGTEEPPATAPARVRVDLRALDDRYEDVTVDVRNGCPVYSLEPRLKKYYKDWVRRLAEPSFFHFFDPEGRLLVADDKFTTETATLWYRVSKSPKPVLNWKFSFWQDRSDAPLDDSLAGAMVKAIDAGATVGELRRKVAEHMGIQDANRVVLVARDGFRRGSLQGDGWEARQVKAWLCRWICVDVNPESGYVIFRGLGRRRYLYHPSPQQLAGGRLSGGDLLAYMETRILRAVHQHGKSELNEWTVKLSLDGKPVGRNMPVKWGATYDFEVSAEDAETFSLEESWLLLPTEMCTVCCERKKVSDMPSRITARCRHKPTTCRDCLKQWLRSSLESGPWDRLRCPRCAEPLDHRDVKLHASKETFDRYDTWTLRAALQGLPDFHFCLSPNCNSGQISSCTEFECVACKARHCVKHNVPWHEGETCDEYDARNRQHARAEKASEDEIKQSTKMCPQCTRRIHKWSGCDHMTCVCGHEFCYVCLAPYSLNPYDAVRCQHAPECTQAAGNRNVWYFVELPLDQPPPQQPAAGRNVNNNNHHLGRDFVFQPQNLRAAPRRQANGRGRPPQREQQQQQAPAPPMQNYLVRLLERRRAQQAERLRASGLDPGREGDLPDPVPGASEVEMERAWAREMGAASDRGPLSPGGADSAPDSPRAAAQPPRGSEGTYDWFQPRLDWAQQRLDWIETRLDEPD